MKLANSFEEKLSLHVNFFNMIEYFREASTDVYKSRWVPTYMCFLIKGTKINKIVPHLINILHDLYLKLLF